MKKYLLVIDILCVFFLGISILAVVSSGEPHFAVAGVLYVLCLFVVSCLWEDMCNG